MSIKITLNGDLRELKAPLTLAALSKELGLDPRKVAVERNLAIVPRSAYTEVTIDDGDRIEIVHFVGGG